MSVSASAETLSDDVIDPGRLGLWLFLLSEILLFGGFFASYVMMRWGSPDCRLGTPAWPAPDYGTTLSMAALNTFILITSSYTMVRSVLACEEGRVEAFRRNLWATIGLGAAFLAVKAVEYSLKFGHGYYPGGHFVVEHPGYAIFFSFYFVMTGLHGVHVLVGLIWNGLLLRSRQDPRSPEFARKAEYAGLYWHFVDVVWVFLFPLFYLI